MYRLLPLFLLFVAGCGEAVSPPVSTPTLATPSALATPRPTPFPQVVFTPYLHVTPASGWQNLTPQVESGKLVIPGVNAKNIDLFLATTDASTGAMLSNLAFSDLGPGSPASLNSLPAAVLATAAQNGVSLTDTTPPQTTTVNGQPATSFVYSITIGGKTIRGRQTYIAHKSHFYLIVATSTPQNFAATDAAVATMTKSIEFTTPYVAP